MCRRGLSNGVDKVQRVTENIVIAGQVGDPSQEAPQSPHKWRVVRSGADDDNGRIPSSVVEVKSPAEGQELSERRPLL
jgi:hypothetical protein